MDRIIPFKTSQNAHQSQAQTFLWILTMSTARAPTMIHANARQ
uniref:Uncharacterized protein n=1 Tax=Anguilla anguilla TaxID=7936 RepID=A0A0E9XEF0_ANGAN